MPDDKTDPAEPTEDQAKPADALKAEAQTDGDPGRKLGADLDALLVENAEMRDRLLRTLADMENLRRRTEREKADTARYAITNFARDVLTVGDNLKPECAPALAPSPTWRICGGARNGRRPTRRATPSPISPATC